MPRLLRTATARPSGEHSRRLSGARRLRIGGASADAITLQVKPDWRTTATALASIISLLLVAAGLFYTNQANRKQQELTTQQQVADRFSAAIEQLGQEDDKDNSKLSIRLGGIYGLQRLMIDSPRDEPAVVQVLSAFVRTHAPRPTNLPDPLLSSTADVRAAITVLGSRPDPGSTPLDLSGTLLGLQDANLPAAGLHSAKLQLVVLARANLRDADLRDADLRAADLSDADLARANLAGADLSGAYLARATLTRTDLHGADLTTANLTSTDLRGADLRNADLRNTNFGGADLTGADLTGALLERGALRNAALTGARGVRPEHLVSPK